jgi:hypothetical protein
MRMEVTGVSESDAPFKFSTRTISVSQHGGVILLEAPLPVGHRFEMLNEFNNRKATCRIVSVRIHKDGKLHGAFELHCPEGNFWSMSFPKAGARPMKRVFVAKSVVR